MKFNENVPSATTFALILALSFTATAQEKQTLITNVNVFDGFADEVVKDMDVLIEGNHIVQVGQDIEAPEATVIDGGGRTLTWSSGAGNALVHPPDPPATVPAVSGEILISFSAQIGTEIAPGTDLLNVAQIETLTSENSTFPNQDTAEVHTTVPDP